MTLETKDFVVTHDGDGVSTSFPYSKPFDDLADLRVELRGTDFKIKPTPGFTASGESGGATITITSGAPAAGERVAIYRETDLTQKTNYTSGDFPASAHENAADRLTMMAQERAGREAMTLRFAVVHAGDAAIPEIKGSLSSEQVLVTRDGVPTLIDAADFISENTALLSDDYGRVTDPLSELDDYGRVVSVGVS